jgi:four helix bundle protein
MPEDPPSFLPPGGNYQDLLSYKKSEIIYDFTLRFCEKHLNRSDRTIDQMVQAARSGKQNIAEGSKASVTSTEMELKLTNVARASLEELLLDYQDYLRVRDLRRTRKFGQRGAKLSYGGGVRESDRRSWIGDQGWSDKGLDLGSWSGRRSTQRSVAE